MSPWRKIFGFWQKKSAEGGKFFEISESCCVQKWVRLNAELIICCVVVSRCGSVWFVVFSRFALLVAVGWVCWVLLCSVCPVPPAFWCALRRVLRALLFWCSGLFRRLLCAAAVLVSVPAGFWFVSVVYPSSGLTWPGGPGRARGLREFTAARPALAGREAGRGWLLVRSLSNTLRSNNFQST